MYHRFIHVCIFFWLINWLIKSFIGLWIVYWPFINKAWLSKHIEAWLSANDAVFSGPCSGLQGAFERGEHQLQAETVKTWKEGEEEAGAGTGQAEWVSVQQAVHRGPGDQLHAQHLQPGGCHATTTTAEAGEKVGTDAESRGWAWLRWVELTYLWTF